MNHGAFAWGEFHSVTAYLLVPHRIPHIKNLAKRRSQKRKVGELNNGEHRSLFSKSTGVIHLQLEMLNNKTDVEQRPTNEARPELAKILEV